MRILENLRLLDSRLGDDLVSRAVSFGTFVDWNECQEELCHTRMIWIFTFGSRGVFRGLAPETASTSLKKPKEMRE